jgi:hypothetical protein
MHVAPRGMRKRRYYLDDPTSIEQGEIGKYLSPDGSIQVCAHFFSFVTGKSMNFLYQPGESGSEMVEDIQCSRWRKCLKDDAITQFLRDISKFYQMSPDTADVYLPFPKRSVVASIYNKQAETSLKCHEGYFITVWRRNPLSKHIKLRKHLRFALCDELLDLKMDSTIIFYRWYQPI